MSHKIQISAAIIAVIVAVIWVSSPNDNPSPEKISSNTKTLAIEFIERPEEVIERPKPAIVEAEFPESSEIFENEKYTNAIDDYLKGLAINEDEMADETVKETLATYTNSDGQQIEIIVKSGTKVEDIQLGNISEL